MRFVGLRPLTAEEAAAIKRLAHSRTAPARVVERAQMLWRAHGGEHAPAIAGALGLHPDTVRRWLTRFNARGLSGLEDQPRSGRPATYLPEEVAEVVAAALTKPEALALPFAAWTLDRLAAYLHDEKGIAIRRSRIDELLRSEGLRWRTQEKWFGERVDPEFARKRGSSKRSTPRRPKAV